MSKESGIAIQKIEDYLIASIQTALHDEAAEQFQNDLLVHLKQTHAKGVIIDVSIVDVVDSFLGRILIEVAAMVKLAGAKVVVVGIQPAVAITIVEFGMQLKGIEIAMNLEKGLELLKKRLNSEDM